MRADCRAAFVTIIIFTKQKELRDIRNSPQKKAPAAACSSGISIKVNRDTGNTAKPHSSRNQRLPYYITKQGKME
jgi:hypothetical protein